jgi:cytochrome c-type biogenesis protein CcmH/NrfG
MKPKLLFPVLLALVTAAMLLAQNQSQSPRNEYRVSVQPKTNLDVVTVRIKVGEFYLDRTMRLICEGLNAEGEIEVTRTVNLDAKQVKAWVNAADPDATLETTVLTFLKLSKKVIP